MNPLSFAPAFAALCSPAVPSLLAYIGPGTGLSALGAGLALLVGLAVAFFAFLWYPIRRYRRRRRERAAALADPARSPSARGPASLRRS